LESKKISSIVWRHMGETVIYSLLVGGTLVYLLSSHGLANWSAAAWPTLVSFGLVAFGVLVIGGLAFGYFRSHTIRSRLESLTSSMRLLETGTPCPPLPEMGTDEIGRLSRQLDRIRRKWEDQVATLQRMSANLAELETRARMNAVLEERQRLARELHDSVSQQLFAISMTATAVRRTLDQDFERARRQVELIEEMAAVAQSEMRALLLHLRPVRLEGKRLTQAVRELVDEIKAKVTMDISLHMDEDLLLNKGIENHLFRLVQEAISNTLRHARASKMDITLQRRGDTVRLSVHDNGIGFDTQAKRQASYGLLNMEERVNELGGSIQVTSAPGKGTRVDIRVPLVKEETAEQDAETATVQKTETEAAQPHTAQVETRKSEAAKQQPSGEGG